MPTSIAHAFGGLAAAEGSVVRGWSRARLLLFCTVVANLPDLDFIPGILAGDAGRFHRHATHSLLATLLFALACLLWARLRRRAAPGDAIRFAWLGLLVYGSHLALDMLVATPTENAGVPLFSPFLGTRYYLQLHLPAPLAALLDLDFDKRQHFFQAVLSPRGLQVFLGHAALFALLPLFTWLIRLAWQRRPGRAQRYPRRTLPTLEPETEDAA
ncbi:MAG TPA: metal-dependent hydrolase [Longimicrobiales bacterium]